MKVEVSVVIANWNTTKWLKDAFGSAIKQGDIKAEVIIVDNGSKDGAVGFMKRQARKFPKRVRGVILGENYGPGRAWNEGIKLARTPYICILNSDAKLTKGSLKKMVDTLKADDRIGITGPMCNNISSAQGVSGPVDRDNFEIPAGHVMPFVCVVIPRRVIEEVGLLAERFTKGGHEDIEYCNRVRKAGYKTVVTGRAFCWHALSQSYKANEVNVNKTNREMAKLAGKDEPIHELKHKETEDAEDGGEAQGRAVEGDTLREPDGGRGGIPGDNAGRGEEPPGSGAEEAGRKLEEGQQERPEGSDGSIQLGDVPSDQDLPGQEGRAVQGGDALLHGDTQEGR